MPTLLRLDSSADLRSSTSRTLTGVFAETWQARGPGHPVVERDLHRSPLPHLPDAALHYAPRLRAEGENPVADAERVQEELLAELSAVDAVVIGAPMYNWSLPSTLKAWLDYVHVLGTSVPFDTDDQPFAGLPVVVVASRGQAYSEATENAGDDNAVPPLVRVLATSMGMAVTVVTAELTLAERIPAMAPLAGKARASLDAATERVRELAATLGGS
ncbi:FMN-dependent NADH-azoreductase [Prauserella marina]|uniref:FMN dependent NADH:quinone oxidoreductase n=1 Tax=Prauserella marina TaxID=530584 RepID=A0A222VQ82_9PSEU|nr:NAD(P)H-dependent oxidoreductase [Prauserella marina]ASR36075.1 FMN-dependent NADH-azoreductase [Prauserella marina]PWV76804.1 FMN-dependent NADH-azoreductase [Prauserella marina]SDC97979.1 FMN-dependent NADH-azoreductase [Prauserella marina]